jgi:hypothetical protein
MRRRALAAGSVLGVVMLGITAQTPQPGELYKKFDIELAKQTIKIQGCLDCHRLDGQGSRVGPDLDRIGLRAEELFQKLGFDSAPDFVRQSLLDPDAYVEPGFPKGIMPKTYGDKLRASEFENLVKYLSSLK